MYDLKRVSETQWSFSRDKKKLFVGDLKEVCQVAVSMGFFMEDIEDGVVEMAWMDHDAANFGIFKSFVFSYDTKGKQA